MTPSVPEILRGNFAVLALSPPAGPDDAFGQARVTVVALLNLLCAQEVERVEAVEAAENTAIAKLLVSVGEEVPTGEADRTARNADLRRRLTRLHERVESTGDRTTDKAILRLYRDMADARRLTLPPLP